MTFLDFYKEYHNIREDDVEGRKILITLLSRYISSNLLTMKHYIRTRPRYGKMEKMDERKRRITEGEMLRGAYKCHKHTFKVVEGK